MAKTKIDLEGKDNASRAFQSASERLAMLRREIDSLRRTDITVADARKLGALTSEANRLEKAITGIGTTAANSARQTGSAFDGIRQALGGLGISMPALGAAGFTAAAVGAGKLALELGAVGEQSKKSATYFQTFSGSAETAAANLNAITTATDGALSRQQAMQASSKLLSMELATNAADLAKVSRMAVLLGGDTRGAAQAIDEFSLLLANKSILRLDTFGISGMKVKARMEELQRTIVGLSSDAAFLQAVMEIGGQKVAALEAAGVSAGSGMDKASAAAADLKATLGELIAEPYTVVINVVTRNLRALEGLTTGEGIEPPEGKASLLERLAASKGPQAELRRATEDYSAALAVVAAWQAKYNEVLATGDTAAINFANSQLAAARAAADAEGADLDAAKAAAGLTTARQDAAAAAGAGITSELDYAAAVDGATAADLRAAKAAGDKSAARTTGTFTEPSKTRWGLFADYAKHFDQAGSMTIEQWVKRNEKANETIAKDWQSAMEKAGQAAAKKIEGYLSKGAQASINLKDMTTGSNDPFAPGSNGPFENIYRLQAWINDGSWAETAAQLGITSKEAAAEIVRDFQMGNITPGVEGAIDMAGLVDLAKLQASAEANYSAFAQKVAALAGTDTTTAGAVLSGVFGGATTTGTTGGIAEAEKAASSALAAFAGAVETEVKKEDFAGRMSGFGETMWGYTEKGIIKKAQNSTAFQGALNAMVAKALEEALAE